MSYVSLYRKYRPSTFDEVIGQDHIVQILTNQVISGNVAHAYLFCGTRGTGKTSVARIFAKAVNCSNPSMGSPCQECEQCIELSRPNNMDIIEIDAASNNSIDDIRDIRESVKYPPVSARYKVYIIDEVHQLSGAAFNGLLKTLEEPPSHAIFILATTEAHKILQTILSRCIKLDFRLVSLDILAAHVKRIYNQEGIEYEEYAVQEVARAGEGSVRDTISIADMCMAYQDTLVTYEGVLEVLGANNPMLIADITNAILSGDLAKSLTAIDSSASLGKSVTVLARDITKFLRDLLIVKRVKSNDFLQLPNKLFDLALTIADRYSEVSILRALEILSSVDMNMKYSSFPKILLESAIGKIATLEGADNIDLIAKVDTLTKKVDCLESNITNVSTIQQATNKNTESHDTDAKSTKIIDTIFHKSQDTDVTQGFSTYTEISKTTKTTTDSSRNITNASTSTEPIDSAIKNKSGFNCNTKEEKAITETTINANSMQYKIQNILNIDKDEIGTAADLPNIDKGTIAASPNTDNFVSNEQETIELQEVDAIELSGIEPFVLDAKEEEVVALRGGLINALRNKNAITISKIIGDESSVQIVIDNNNITIKISRDGEYNYLERKKELLNECIIELKGEGYLLTLEHHAVMTDKDYIKKIAELFGKENINLKNK